MTTLTKLEEKFDAHVEQDDKRAEQIASRLAGIETNLAWMLKIGGAIFGGIITQIIVFFVHK